MMTINSNSYSASSQLVKSSALTSIASLLDTVSILLAVGSGGPASQAKVLLGSDGGSHTYPVGGLYEEFEDFLTEEPGCMRITAWELLANGKVSVLSAELHSGLKWPTVPQQLELDSCLAYLDELEEALQRAAASDSDRMMIQRAAVLELRHRLDQKEDLSGPGGLEGDLPGWWPYVVAYARAQGVPPSPRPARIRGRVALFEDVNVI